MEIKSKNIKQIDIKMEGPERDFIQKTIEILNSIINMAEREGYNFDNVLMEENKDRPLTPASEYFRDITFSADHILKASMVLQTLLMEHTYIMPKINCQKEGQMI